jgi:hypothetical protein
MSDEQERKTAEDNDSEYAELEYWTIQVRTP